MRNIKYLVKHTNKKIPLFYLPAHPMGGSGILKGEGGGGAVKYQNVELRPPLREKSFPVSRVGKIKGHSVGRDFFFFSNFIFYELECTGGKGKKKEENFKNEKKNVSGPF